MADTRLGVEIDNTRIAPFMTLERGARGSIDLATIERGQKRAIVKLFVVRGESRHELGLIDARNLPGFDKRRTLLRLRCAVSRGGRLTAKLDVENRFYREIHADVRRYVSSRRPVAAAAAVLLLIALGAGLYFGLSLGSESAGEPGAASTRGPAAAETPSEPGSEQARPEQPGSAQADSQPSGDRAVEEAGEAPAEARPDAGRSGADSAAVAPASWTVYFLPDSPVLTPQTRSSLDRVAEELSRLPEEATVRIVGHTALAGTEQGRIGLSRDRARNVYRYLQEQGWTPRQEVTVRGVGGNEPVTRDPDRQEQNRRVEIRVEG